MKFFENGPNIPDDLLQKRDAGHVVFLCGAGVSVRSRLPTFVELAERVVEKLNVEHDSPIRSALQPWLEEASGPKEPLDNIFADLLEEYEPELVYSYVTNELRTSPDDPSVGREHKIIVSISTDNNGTPRVVTTNFDLLFEQAFSDPNRAIYTPPTMPTIDAEHELAGIIYLHGRLQTDATVPANYILSGADIGAAYFAHGWAAQFLRSLFARYTVVLVGYQADDFPVRYLLQGLGRIHPDRRQEIYAFDRGNFDEVEQKWRKREVTVIPYAEYDDLWETLEAWATWAENPEAGQQAIAKLAESNPRSCTASERGRVASLVRSASGAKVFAHASPLPHPEWIFVFDSRFRMTGSTDSHGIDQALPDSVAVYGLDTDHAPVSDSKQPLTTDAEDLLASLPSDKSLGDSHKVQIQWTPTFEFAPPRLVSLMEWLAQNSNSPVIAWWALRQHSLHPILIQAIREHLRSATTDSAHPLCIKAWSIILDFHSDPKQHCYNRGLLHSKQRVTRENWTPSAIRDFGLTIAPFFEVYPTSPTYTLQTLPRTWDDISIPELCRLRVTFPQDIDHHLEIPDKSLNSIVSILEDHLRRATDMMQDLGTAPSDIDVCYPDREVDGNISHGEVENALQLFLQLFLRLASHSPSLARAYASTWPASDPFFFRHLILYALNQKDLFGANEVVSVLDRFPQDAFWDFKVRRELIYLISDRWTEFSAGQQCELCDRLLRGPSQPETLTANKYEEYRRRKAAWYVTSLKSHGCVIPKHQQGQLDTLISQIPDWRDGEGSTLTIRHGVHFGWVNTDESPNELLDAQVEEVVGRALALSRVDLATFTEMKPFSGLVTQDPAKALAALVMQAEAGKYPSELWNQLLRHWPKSVDTVVLEQLLQAMAGLPYEQVFMLDYSIGTWVQDQLTDALTKSPNLTWRVLDHIIAGLEASSDNSPSGDLDDPDSESYSNSPENRTLNYAINDAMGKITEGVLSALRTIQLEPGGGIPREHAKRLDALASISGELGHPVAAVLAHNMFWLYHIDPAWTTDVIVPWFDVTSPVAQSAWSGFAYSGLGVPTPLADTMKDYLVRVFPTAAEHNWGNEVREFVANAIVSLVDIQSKEPSTLTVAEVRDCLRKMDRFARVAVIYALKRRTLGLEDGWRTFFIPFVQGAWPKEDKFRSERESTTWVQILPDAGDCFKDTFDAVKHLLIPVRSPHTLTDVYHYDVRGQSSIAELHPDAVLELISRITPNQPDNVPFHLASLLHKIASAEPDLKRDSRWQRLHGLISQA